MGEQAPLLLLAPGGTGSLLQDRARRAALEVRVGRRARKDADGAIRLRACPWPRDPEALPQFAM
jgi:hypothetical protein